MEIDKYKEKYISSDWLGESTSRLGIGPNTPDPKFIKPEEIKNNKKIDKNPSPYSRGCSGYGQHTIPVRPPNCDWEEMD